MGSWLKFFGTSMLCTTKRHGNEERASSIHCFLQNLVYWDKPSIALTEDFHESWARHNDNVLSSKFFFVERASPNWRSLPKSGTLVTSRKDVALRSFSVCAKPQNGLHICTGKFIRVAVACAVHVIQTKTTVWFIRHFNATRYVVTNEPAAHAKKKDCSLCRSRRFSIPRRSKELHKNFGKIPVEVAATCFAAYWRTCARLPRFVTKSWKRTERNCRRNVLVKISTGTAARSRRFSRRARKPSFSATFR